MPAYEIKITDRARTMAERMDFLTLIDQASCPRVTEDPDRLYGGMFLGGRLKSDGVRRHADMALALDSENPPIITGDLECGSGVMVPDLTYFQSQMALGAAHDEKLAFEIGKAAAIEGRSVGYDWSFSPCVDIASEPDNPITSVRSSGTKPDTIIPAARGYLQGMQAGGILATLKHFPGEGQTPYDQHLTTVHNPLSKADWDQGPGRIYKELVEAGAATVMPGHIALPSFEPQGLNGGGPMPATVSPRILKDLLRGEVGFKGLIVSDAIGMGGVSNYGQYFEMCARFWEAGGDMLLFPHLTPRFYKEMERLRDAGILNEETLRDRVVRILSLKDQEGVLDGRERPRLDLEPSRRLAKELSQKSVTLVRDRAGYLPLKPDKVKKILHLVLDCHDVDTYDTKAAAVQMTKALEKEFGDVEVRDDSKHSSVLQDEVFDRTWDAIVVSIFVGPSYGNSTVRLRSQTSRVMMNGWIKLGTPVVFVLHRHPFTYTEFEDAMDCVIATYGSTLDAIDVAVAGIAGKGSFKGKLP